MLRRAGREETDDAPEADVVAESGVEDGETMDAEEGHEAGREEWLSRARTWSHVALYWATDTRIFTASPVLKPERDPDAPVGPDGELLPHIPCYRYIGTARYEDFPAYVARDAVAVHRDRGRGPPPPGLERKGSLA